MRLRSSRRFFVLTCLVIIQLACAIFGAPQQPAPAPVIMVVTATRSAMPAATATTRPTITAVPLFTAGPAPSATPDLRLIQGEPEDFQLTLADLPPSAGYWLLSQGSGIDPTDRDEEWQQEYQEKVGESDFYMTRMDRDRDNLAYPDRISCDVGKFTSVPFAGEYLKEYNLTKDVDRANGGIYLPAVEEFPGLGDARHLSHFDFEYEGNTETYYVIMASYRNYIIECWGGGLKDDVPPDFIAGLVQIILDKLKTAPLLPPPSNS